MSNRKMYRVTGALIGIRMSDELVQQFRRGDIIPRLRTTRRHRASLARRTGRGGRVKNVSYEADANCAVRLPDGQVAYVRRGATFPIDVDPEIAETFVAAGVATRFEEI